jgi:hypothetical protein
LQFGCTYESEGQKEKRSRRSEKQTSALENEVWVHAGVIQSVIAACDKFHLITARFSHGRNSSEPADPSLTRLSKRRFLKSKQRQLSSRESGFAFHPFCWNLPS